MRYSIQFNNSLRKVVFRSMQSPKYPHQLNPSFANGSNKIFSRNPSAHLRFLSSNTSSAIAEAKVKKDDSNIFLDNLGKIFLTAIAGIVGALIRSSYNTSNRNAVRDEIEDSSALDPVEIDELRIANSVLSPDVFLDITEHVYSCFPTGTCTYQEFTRTVRKSMMQHKGEAFTVELGHQIDRVVAKILMTKKVSVDDDLPLSLWLVTLTLALNSSIEERFRVIYQILEKEEQPVTFHQIPVLVSYLQDTCQLPPDTQVVATATKFPTQQWKKGTPPQLVPWEGGDNDIIDLKCMADILRSKSVCVWGECYQKKPFQIHDPQQ